MKKIIIFLVCCILFVSCNKNEIFNKKNITLKEMEKYISNIEKNKYCSAYYIILADKENEINKNDISQDQLKKIVEEVYYDYNHGLVKDSRIMAAAYSLDEFYDIESIDKLINKKNKEYFKLIATNIDQDKGKYIKDGTVKLYKKIPMFNLSRYTFVNIENNKINNVFSFTEIGKKKYDKIVFTETKKIKEKIYKYNIQGNALVTHEFINDETTFKKIRTTYVFLEPVIEKNKKITGIAFTFDDSTRAVIGFKGEMAEIIYLK